ncbi:M24 family metallopeptidase [Bradyrhizobium cenepequi]|uniref:M24 family metallopeptidase n=1 Tax=Bradyrhizobium cenepequi TaxID=2821403 RepID=UPI001CE3610F|nr:Xaa-Pro peptidase family protein [Bradyrhizobium cenepequi]MCA6112197.1 aminopeptidase P family protein [Bradyrhizobium cenepequi]
MANRLVFAVNNDVAVTKSLNSNLVLTLLELVLASAEPARPQFITTIITVSGPGVMNQSVLETKSTSPQPNTSALRSLARNLGVDAVIAMSPENFVYTSGVHLMSVSHLRRQAFAVLPATAEPIALVATTERSQMVDGSWIKDIRTYTEFANDPADALADVLIELGKNCGTIGIDLNYLPARTHARLASRLPNVRLIDTNQNLAAIRAVKVRGEIELLERVTRQTHRAVLDAMSAARLGETERVMANRIAEAIVNDGADECLMIFGSGPRSSNIHACATDRIPLKSEIVRLDVGGRYGAWGSDFARTYSTGAPTALQRETYGKLWDLHTSTISMIRPGMAAEEPFFFCKDHAEKLGLNFKMVWVGHGFGIETHEFPMIRPGEKTKLEVGMVFNTEPMVTDAEGAMYHLEDLFVVTERGTRLLTLGFGPREIPIIGEQIRMQE